MTHNMEEIGVDVFKKEIGEELFNKNTNYVLEYFSMNEDEYHEPSPLLSAVKNKDGSYSVYENERGLLINLIRRTGKSPRSKLMIIPMGIMRTISHWILDKHSMIGSEVDINPTVYGSLFFAIELPEEDRLDLFLFYTGILLIDAYMLDLKRTGYESLTKKSLYIKGEKNELIFDPNNPDDMTYSLVNYFISVYNDKDTIKINKVYKAGIEDNTFELKIDELVNTAINDFRTNKK